ncbi:hypothetical protein MEN41_04490 [Dolichospermum sp. ST_con]|nr:hypothetical protein [Dolichospermum sp. ST_con]MDD1419506.1 hypothetical protein [Dolichospermum sp. ST_sed1]MDD1431131.1 hypothetical protein [Dolichospermum sp. ST_sed6]MDD1455842.1 hypothetical protein [Dolichospermum sp. ST_sed7]MDD1460554.1 hypothetical protein [Dolichospermum sp. ST_sed2]
MENSFCRQLNQLEFRLKTLFDGLRCPSNKDEIKEIEPKPNEKPFYCLLEDDKLITKVSVTTKRLLGSDIEKDKVRELHKKNELLAAALRYPMVSGPSLYY